MAKLSTREVDALVHTIVEQIIENNKNSLEMVKYRKDCEITKELNKEISSRTKEFRDSLEKEMKKRIDKTRVKRDSYSDSVSISSPDKPQSLVDKTTIERELIISNIKGNVDETIEKLVSKYTKG